MLKNYLFNCILLFFIFMNVCVHSFGNVFEAKTDQKIQITFSPYVYKIDSKLNPHFTNDIQIKLGDLSMSIPLSVTAGHVGKINMIDYEFQPLLPESFFVLGSMVGTERIMTEEVQKNDLMPREFISYKIIQSFEDKEPRYYFVSDVYKIDEKYLVGTSILKDFFNFYDSPEFNEFLLPNIKDYVMDFVSKDLRLALQFSESTKLKKQNEIYQIPIFLKSKSNDELDLFDIHQLLYNSFKPLISEFHLKRLIEWNINFTLGTFNWDAIEYSESTFNCTQKRAAKNDISLFNESNQLKTKEEIQELARSFFQSCTPK